MSEPLVISRNGAVRVRTHTKAEGVLLGWVERDRKNRRVWRGVTPEGVRVSEASTRTAALAGLSEHFARTELKPVAAEEHKVTTGPIDVVPEDAQRPYTRLEWATFISVGALGAGVLALAAWGLTFLA